MILNTLPSTLPINKYIYIERYILKIYYLRMCVVPTKIGNMGYVRGIIAQSVVEVG